MSLGERARRAEADTSVRCSLVRILLRFHLVIGGGSLEARGGRGAAEVRSIRGRAIGYSIVLVVVDANCRLRGLRFRIIGSGASVVGFDTRADGDISYLSRGGSV